MQSNFEGFLPDLALRFALLEHRNWILHQSYSSQCFPPSLHLDGTIIFDAVQNQSVPSYLQARSIHQRESRGVEENQFLPFHQLDETILFDGQENQFMPTTSTPHFRQFEETILIDGVHTTITSEEGQSTNRLWEETISKNLRTKVKSSLGNQNSTICVICQDEYEKNQIVGYLGCGHEYHAGCIKRWLLHKNVCPICKRLALPELS